MARRFANVSEEEIQEAFFYASDLGNTKTSIPLRVGEERYISRLGIYPLPTSPSGDSCIISFLNHFKALPKKAKITLVSFSHGIALFSSSIFSINGGSGPLDTFLFVVFLFFSLFCRSYFSCK